MFHTKKDVIDHLRTLSPGEHILDVPQEGAKLVLKAVSDYAEAAPLVDDKPAVVAYTHGSRVGVRIAPHDWVEFEAREYINRSAIREAVLAVQAATFIEGDARAVAYVRQMVSVHRKGQLKVRLVENGCIVAPKKRSSTLKEELKGKLDSYSEPFEVEDDEVALLRTYLVEYNKTSGRRFGTRRTDGRFWVVEKVRKGAKDAE